MCKPLNRVGQVQLQSEGKVLSGKHRVRWADRIFCFSNLTKISALSVHYALRNRPSQAVLCLGSVLFYNQGETRNESIFLYNIRDFQKGASQPRWNSDTWEDVAYSLDSGGETKLSTGWKLLSAHVILRSLIVCFASKPSKWALEHFQQLFNLFDLAVGVT